jgi:hypothetical protein
MSLGNRIGPNVLKMCSLLLLGPLEETSLGSHSVLDRSRLPIGFAIVVAFEATVDESKCTIQHSQ